MSILSEKDINLESIINLVIILHMYHFRFSPRKNIKNTFSKLLSVKYHFLLVFVYFILPLIA